MFPCVIPKGVKQTQEKNVHQNIAINVLINALMKIGNNLNDFIYSRIFVLESWCIQLFIDIILCINRIQICRSFRTHLQIKRFVENPFILLKCMFVIYRHFIFLQGRIFIFTNMQVFHCVVFAFQIDFCSTLWTFFLYCM